MKKEDIITLPNPHLRQKSERVHVITPEILKLVDDMTSASIDWEDNRPHEISAALAAVQIDSLERVVIVRNSFDDKDDRKFTALINPEITKTEGTPVEDYEGCLSVSDIYGRVKRAPKVRVKALDINGNTVRIKAEGYLARVLQHEIDHTHGVLFIDHIKGQTDAFFQLNNDGELDPLDYDTHVKDNTDLWN